MPINSRNKGKTGEIEARDMWRALLEGKMEDTDDIRRNHQQAEIGGADLVGIPRYAVEVKRCKQINWIGGLDSWWEQCAQQASDLGKEPLLMFRQDHGKWFVMLWGAVLTDTGEAVWQKVILRWEEFEMFVQTAWNS